MYSMTTAWEGMASTEFEKRVYYIDKDIIKKVRSLRTVQISLRIFKNYVGDAKQLFIKAGCVIISLIKTPSVPLKFSRKTLMHCRCWHSQSLGFLSFYILKKDHHI